MINREDMLELTRRMTPKRNCFTRIAGGYFDKEGVNMGTFNTNFLNLPMKEKEKNIAIAKAVPFSPTNENLKKYGFSKENMGKGSMWQLLMGMKSCWLKNDALMEIFYEMVAAQYHTTQDYAVMVFHGCYDVPIKGTDKQRQDESEEVFEFLICLICKLEGDYEPGEPECGFLFPAFTNRSSDSSHVAVYQADLGKTHPEIEKILGCTF